MILRCCIVIPTFNNEKTINKVVEECLAVSKFPVVVVDDGSKIPVQIDHLRVTVVRHDRNKGKGAALQTGFATCLARGFTHAISIDGDGQHDPKDMLSLVEAATHHPWDIIVGSRRMDATTAPRASVIGRMFSNFFLWYQTNTYINDSQSGFRIYPLFHMQTKKFFTKRFDFEFEVLTRCLWRGVRIRMVPISVRYFSGEERVSHFHKFYDNARITVLNIVTVCWSFLRFQSRPHQILLAGAVGAALMVSTGSLTLSVILAGCLCLVLRCNLLVMLTAVTAQDAFEDEAGRLVTYISILTAVSLLYFVLRLWTERKREEGTWTGRLRGGRFGTYLIAKINEAFGQRISYACMFLVVPYFFFFAPSARRSSFELASVIYPHKNIFGRIIFVFKHFYVFATVMLDRLYQSRFEEAQYSFTSNGGEALIERKANGTGTILVTAHFGAMDIVARATKNKGIFDRMVRAEFVAGTRDTVEHVFKRKNNSGELPVITQDEQSVLLFKQLIEHGKTIGMMGDRAMNAHFELVPFCGKLAVFNSAPYRVAAACKCPIFLGYGKKTGMWTYELTAEELELPNSGDRELDAYLAVKRYAHSLERQLRTAPEQWSNFFPFWSTVAKPPKMIMRTRSRVRLLEDIVMQTTFFEIPTN